MRPPRPMAFVPVVVLAVLAVGAFAFLRVPVPPVALAASDPAGTVPLQVTQGTELSKKDDAAVKKVLTDYMAAMKRGDYVAAARHLDRESYLRSVDPMVGTIASDSTQSPAAMRRIFGVSTRDSIAQLPLEQTYPRLMSYLEEINPNLRPVMEKADIRVLAARQLAGRVSVAYQLTVPADSVGAEPYTSISAQQLTRVGKEWKIVLRVD